MESKYEDDLNKQTSSQHLNNFISYYSTSFSNEAVKYSSVDDIIEKYKHTNKSVDQSSHSNLYRNVGNHALREIKKPNSVQNCTKENKILINNDDEEQVNNRFISFRCETNNHYVNKFTLSNAKLTSNEKVYHDKTTYCRPVINYYNEQFLYKTMERNARLKLLVKKLAIARQREKEIVSWNNFINDLKTKHGENFGNRKHISIIEDPEDNSPEIINDYYKTRFSCVQSNPCRHLLQDLYETYNDSLPNYITDRSDGNAFIKHEVNSYIPNNKDSYCYPTSSQGRIIMDKRRAQEQQKRCLSKWRNNLNLTVNNKTHGTSNNDIHKYLKTNNKNCNTNDFNAMKVTKSSAIQTDEKFNTGFISGATQDKATYKAEGGKTKINNIEKDEDNIIKSNNSLNQISLTSIDAKLVALIESINIFINEIKLNKVNRSKTKFDILKCKHCDRDERTYQMENNYVQNKNTTPDYDGKKCISTTKVILSKLGHCKLESASNPDEIIQEVDVHRSKSTQINDKNTKQPCSVQIDFEIPTKDDTTEITKSLAKHDFENLDTRETTNERRLTNDNEINLQDDLPCRQMTIAVNTDPLSLLSLLKISTDAIRQLLSYMPNLDYYSYLSQIQFPQTRQVESHYVCNICGADFNKPSLLSDHITDHDLGKTRDCCVCRHVLDLARKYPGLFRCQYCGQLFARAYCCELHQESCAKRFGRRHDVTASLVLLR